MKLSGAAMCRRLDALLRKALHVSKSFGSHQVLLELFCGKGDMSRAAEKTSMGSVSVDILSGIDVTNRRVVKLLAGMCVICSGRAVRVLAVTVGALLACRCLWLVVSFVDMRVGTGRCSPCIRHLNISKIQRITINRQGVFDLY